MMGMAAAGMGAGYGQAIARPRPRMRAAGGPAMRGPGVGMAIQGQYNAEAEHGHRGPPRPMMRPQRPTHLPPGRPFPPSIFRPAFSWWAFFTVTILRSSGRFVIGGNGCGLIAFAVSFFLVWHCSHGQTWFGRLSTHPACTVLGGGGYGRPPFPQQPGLHGKYVL